MTAVAIWETRRLPSISLLLRRHKGLPAQWLLCLLSVCLPNRLDACPQNCNGHGYCQIPDRQICHCYDGWSGPDCSQRVCPAGPAWADIPSATDVAHAALTECSNMGFCNRRTGECLCRKGFEGAACERMSCPVATNGLTCAGRGKCLSMREAAQSADPRCSLQYEADYSLWDADMIFGCACQEGFAGYDCSETECPRADDPETAGVDEVQVLDCQCVGCSGAFRLSYRGQSTQTIPWDATPEFLKFRLEELENVQQATVASNNAAITERRLCTDAGSTTSITIQHPVGNVSVLRVDASGLAGDTSGGPIILSIRSKGATSQFNAAVSSVQGTKEWAECANRGTCDRSNGQCTCLWPYFKPSDQFGAAGTYWDCGYKNTSAPLTTCPIASPNWGPPVMSACSGVGTCSAASDWKCVCPSGYTGVACEWADCPTGRAWFDEAVSSDQAHRTATCSNRGLCMRKTGKCSCDPANSKHNFIDDNCGKLDCGWTNAFGTVVPFRCGNRGACMSLAEAAFLHTDSHGDPDHTVTYNTSWEAERIHLCSCAVPYATDNQGLHVNRNNTYRGPYAYASTPWKGYDCSKAYCPRGDYSRREGLNEIQRINCSATNGSFHLFYRGAKSEPIYYNNTKAVFKRKVEEMTTITTVRVIFDTIESPACKPHMACAWICNEGGGNFVDVEFVTEFGDLPMLTADVTLLGGNVTITRRVKGTRLNVECSMLGNCDEETGRCKCLPGWSSSSGKEVYAGDGSQSMGHRGDCGWRNPESTAAYVPNLKVVTGPALQGTSNSWFGLQR